MREAKGMSRPLRPGERRIKVIAWGLWALFLIVLSLAAYLGSNPATGPGIGLVGIIWATSFIGFPTAGALVAPRMPDRPLGWMLLVAPLFTMVGVALSDLARFIQGASPSTTAWILWGGGVLFAAGFPLLLMVPFYLPDGKLPSRRWRPVARALLWLTALFIFPAAFTPGPMETRTGREVSNPLGLESLAGVFKFLEAALGLLFLMVIGLGVASLVTRFRGAGGIERQQLKWLALGGSGILISLLSIVLIQAFIRDLAEVEITILIVLAILSLPASIAVAVLKTKLYDVDVIINRTLVYAALTAVLASSYLGVVVLLQRLLEPFTQQSDLAVAGSTLVVAALARPLKTRLQDFIDQRFYRRKYDAAETLDAFSSHLRDGVDLESLTRELVSVVGRTMQPSHASLWLRTGTE